MPAVTITAPRGPVSLSKVTWSPIENEYICKVESVNGTLRNVPILTFPAVPALGHADPGRMGAAVRQDQRQPAKLLNLFILP